MKNLLRALSYFKQDWRSIIALTIFLVVSIGLNVLKPWPLALMVDSVLGSKPFPSWAPSELTSLNRSAQLTSLIGVLVVLHLGHSTVSAVQLYLSIGVGL